MKERKCPGCGHAGFTLVELTVVVIIVTVLFLIVMPVLTPHRHGGKTRHSACASNEKQIALGMLMYAQDYDERFPLVGAPHTSGHMASWGPSRRIIDSVRRETWVPGLLSVYLKSDEIFWCPEVSRGPEGRLDYLYNDLVAAESRKDVTAPHWTVLLVDGDTLDVNAGHARSGESAAVDGAVNAAGTCDARRGATVSDRALTRHGGGANYAFADGHVKWFKAVSEAGDVPLIFFPACASNSSSRLFPKGVESGPRPDEEPYRGSFHAR